MRRPNKRQRKKNAKRDGTWIKQPAGRQRKFRKTSRGRADSAPVTGKWKTIVARYSLRTDTRGLRHAEAAVMSAAARIQLQKSFARYAEACKTASINFGKLGETWAKSPQAEMLRRRYGE